MHIQIVWVYLSFVLRIWPLVLFIVPFGSGLRDSQVQDVTNPLPEEQFHVSPPGDLTLNTMQLPSQRNTASRAIITGSVPLETSTQASTEQQYYGSSVNPLEELHYALEAMQKLYYQLWLGTWPTAIDWTAAVMGTHLSASLFTLSRSLEYILPGTMSNENEGERVENEINKYFSQSTSYYFGENAIAIRMEAYDDMLWVVLGWLESIKFIQAHNDRHYAPSHYSVGSEEWYGKQFIPGFAHRSRVFYDLASEGWNTTLCGGGMIWNPRLEPYKNAVTNELFISASIGMYLYFTGDDNSSPFRSQSGGDMNISTPTEPQDPKYLQAAVDGYAWLKASNMTNNIGLYVDGFHIRDWGKDGGIGTGKCDVRDETVYTYNQGIILSGLRGLWEGTGDLSYLEDGHELIRNVIAATGWESSNPTPGEWVGLGRDGVLEDACDSRGDCSQDGQTFKGIFFHHLTIFCEPLPSVPLIPGKSFAANPTEAKLHSQSCKEYAPWVAHNGEAALQTRDSLGRFGMWWGQPIANKTYSRRDSPLLRAVGENAKPASSSTSRYQNSTKAPTPLQDSDPNDRGRGRTVETQGGGVAVMRAMWEFVNIYKP